MNFFETIITEEAFKEVNLTLTSTNISEGLAVAEFEKQLEQQFGYKYGVGVNSCTSALHLALVMAGVGRGDEVILPAQTFVATGLAVLYCGATPVFVDIQKETGNIDPLKIGPAITLRAKAVICVSWGGNPCDLLGLQKVCEHYGLTLIQDNAQAFGATYMGKPISSYGDFSCFSFQAIKHLTTGDGGLLVCRDEKLRQKAKSLSWFGIDRTRDLPDETGERVYNLDVVGYKYHMNDIAASLGLGNLHGVKSRLRRRREIVDVYENKLSDISTFRYPGSANWLYTILVDERKNFIRAMKERDIPVSVVHCGIDRNAIFGETKHLPIQRYWDEHHICLPIHSSLADEDVYEVVEAINVGW